MSAEFSSAGLLYVYIRGYEENGEVFTEQVDSYRYIGNSLYHKIMEMADEAENTVHIFAVVGSKDKANFVSSIFENELRANFQRILNGSRIKTNTSKLDDVGNVFFRCVQEFYCTQLNHFPKRVYYDYGNIAISGIYCLCNENAIVDAVVSLWSKRERPELCGKQLMTRSFFMQDFADRKVIASIPDAKTGSWRLVFEGGHQLYLSEETPYTKETLYPGNGGAFCSSNRQSILLNPIYAYGKRFQPDDISEEWHKVFLYLCAISDIDWDSSGIHNVYERFLGFLEENICLTTEATPVISEELYDRALLIHIADFRKFLQGEDGPVISKDLLQTLNSRYVYLPYLRSLVQPTFLITHFLPANCGK